MDDYPRILKESLVEMEKLLSARSVVGEPVTANGATVIPLVSTGFTFGAGSGPGAHEPANGEPEGGRGAGASGLARPVAVIVVDKGGNVRVERVRAPGPLRMLADAARSAILPSERAARKPASAPGPYL